MILKVIFQLQPDSDVADRTKRPYNR